MYHQALIVEKSPKCDLSGKISLIDSAGIFTCGLPSNYLIPLINNALMLFLPVYTFEKKQNQNIEKSLAGIRCSGWPLLWLYTVHVYPSTKRHAFQFS